MLSGMPSPSLSGSSPGSGRPVSVAPPVSVLPLVSVGGTVSVVEPVAVSAVGRIVVVAVSPVGTATADDALVARLKQHVSKEIGAIARPADIRFTNALPKTRSGKIMRRLLRDIASGKEVAGDTSTLEDLSVLAKLRESDED